MCIVPVCRASGPIFLHPLTLTYFSSKNLLPPKMLNICLFVYYLFPSCQNVSSLEAETFFFCSVLTNICNIVDILKIFDEWIDEHYIMCWLFSDCLSAGSGTLRTTFLVCRLAGSLLGSASRGAYRAAAEEKEVLTPPCLQVCYLFLSASSQQCFLTSAAAVSSCSCSGLWLWFFQSVQNQPINTTQR